MKAPITPLVRCGVCDRPAAVEIDEDCFLCDRCEPLLIELIQVPVNPGNASVAAIPAPGPVAADATTNSNPTLLLPTPSEASVNCAPASSAGAPFSSITSAERLPVGSRESRFSERLSADSARGAQAEHVKPSKAAISRTNFDFIDPSPAGIDFAVAFAAGHYLRAPLILSIDNTLDSRVHDHGFDPPRN